MSKKRIFAVAAAAVFLAVVTYTSEAVTRHDHRPAAHATRSKTAGVFAVARNTVIREMTVWERKVIRFINRMVRMYEGSPYSYEHFKEATDDLGRSSRINKS